MQSNQHWHRYASLAAMLVAEMLENGLASAAALAVTAEAEAVFAAADNSNAWPLSSSDFRQADVALAQCFQVRDLWSQ